MVCPNQRAEFASYNSYTININKRNRNFYNCGDLKHLARNYKNRGIEDRIREERRLEYENGNNRQKLMIKGGNRQNNSNLNRTKT